MASNNFESGHLFIHLKIKPLNAKLKDMRYVLDSYIVSEKELTHVLGLCVHLKGISLSTPALTGPQWDYISQHHLSFVTATAIIASLQIHNCPILISSSRVQMWMAGINPPYFDGLHLTDDRCGHYS